jgi:CheY-like chemotaxis protein
LIDDEADKGWELLLKKVFQTSTPEDFVVISEKVTDFDALSLTNKEIIENQKFDLYLIDLRLNGLAEENILKTSEFSGMKMLQKIKGINPGNQVIIFTASNKVWNLKALLDAGADGYYLKESPEYNFSNELSKQNYQQFKKNIKDCFERDYIRGLYIDIQNIKRKLSTLSYPKDFLGELTNQLDLFFDMILKVKTETQFAHTYVTLYMVIEIINYQFVKKVADDKWEIEGIGLLLDWQWNKGTSQYVNTGKEVTGNKPPEWQKLSGLYFQKWKGADCKFIQDIYHLIEKRNGFVHNDSSILEKKDSKGNYVNEDVYTKEGIIKLFDAVKIVINFL